MSSEGGFSHESMQDQESIHAYLQALTDAVAAGKLTFRDGADELRLEPAGLIRFNVTARKSGSRCKVSFKLSWKEEDETLSDNPLIIEAE